MPITFACTSDQASDQATVTLTGELDLEAAGVMRPVGETVINDAVVKAVRVDCAGVTFIDSTALSVFIGWGNEAQARGKTLTFRHVPQVMSRLLTLTGLDQVLDIEPAITDDYRRLG